MTYRTCKVRKLQITGFVIVLTMVCILRVHAQAVPAAEHRLHVQAYGMATYVKPDYSSNNGGERNAGGTIGLDVDGYRPLRHTSLGLDVRYTGSYGTLTNQYLLSAGPRISFNAYRFQPYAVYEMGYGTGKFNQSTNPLYVSDTTTVRSYGGGFDYMLTHYWGVRADVLEQRWRFTRLQPYFHPVAVGVGISYQLHLRSRSGLE